MSPELRATLPFLVLTLATVAVMLLIAWRRDHRLTAIVAAGGLIAALLSIIPAASPVPVAVTPLFLVDGVSLYFLALVCAAALAVLVLSYTYLAALQDGPCEEYYLLLLLATLGAAAVLASAHFGSFFLGLETLSIALIGLIAYPRGRERALEAGVKYLVLAGISSAFLLFGMALIYLDLGTMSFAALGPLWNSAPGPAALYAYAGFALLLTGVGFKLSLVPFHMWAPDIYEGAPVPVSAFIAVISKIAVFGLLLRYFVLTGGYQSPSLLRVIALVAILSMLAGNLLALLQTNVKRILAYASIAHFGYVLVALLAGRAIGLEAVSYYLAAYAAATIGAFAIVTLLSQPGQGADADRLEAYRGLMWSHPWLAGAFTLLLLSLAGLPPTMGFIAEIYVIAAGVGMGLVLPLLALVIGSVIGLYYYLRIVVVLLSSAPDMTATAFGGRRLSLTGGATLAVLVALVIGLGVYPVPLITAVTQSNEKLAAYGAGLRPLGLAPPHGLAAANLPGRPP